MKRLFAIVFCLLFSTLGSAVSQDVLKLCIYRNPPHTFMEKQQPRGFIVDIMSEFCARQHLSLQIVEAPFAELWQKMQRGEADIIAPVAFNQERKAFVDFVPESILIDWSHVVIADSSNLNQLEDLAGRRVGFVKNDYYAQLFARLMQERKIACQFVEYSDFIPIVADVSQNHLDAGFIGRFSLTYILAEQSTVAHIKIMPGSFFHESLYIGVGKHKAALVPLLNTFLKEAKADKQGFFNRAMQRWYGDSLDQQQFKFFRRFFVWFLLAIGLIAILVGVRIATMHRRIRHSSHEIQKQHKLFENLFQHIPIGVVLLDEKRIIIDVNREFEAIFGFVASELQGKALDEWLKPENGTQSPFHYHHETEQRLISEEILYDRHGSAIQVQTILTPVVFAGVAQGFIGIYSDVSERMRMIEAIVKTQNIEALGVMAGGIAHDFNNMLMAVIASIALAKDSTGDALHKHLERAEKAANTAMDLALQLRSFAKGGPPILKPASLHAILHDSVELILHQGKVNVDVACAGVIPPIDVDAIQITQVFNNLLLNAQEVMPHGGLIKIAIGLFKQAVSDSILMAGEYAQVAITDQGPGIPADMLDKVFLPFFTTKKTGSGLGLAISYAIIKNHGGHITVRSEAGRSTCFTVYLPYVAARPVLQ